MHRHWRRANCTLNKPACHNNDESRLHYVLLSLFLWFTAVEATRAWDGLQGCCQGEFNVLGFSVFPGACHIGSALTGIPDHTRPLALWILIEYWYLQNTVVGCFCVFPSSLLLQDLNPPLSSHSPLWMLVLQLFSCFFIILMLCKTHLISVYTSCLCLIIHQHQTSTSLL